MLSFRDIVPDYNSYPVLKKEVRDGDPKFYGHDHLKDQHVFVNVKNKETHHTPDASDQTVITSFNIPRFSDATTNIKLHNAEKVSRACITLGHTKIWEQTFETRQNVQTIGIPEVMIPNLLMAYERFDVHAKTDYTNRKELDDANLYITYDTVYFAEPCYEKFQERGNRGVYYMEEYDAQCACGCVAHRKRKSNC